MESKVRWEALVEVVVGRREAPNLPSVGLDITGSTPVYSGPCFLLSLTHTYPHLVYKLSPDSIISQARMSVQPKSSLLESLNLQTASDSVASGRSPALPEPPPPVPISLDFTVYIPWRSHHLVLRILVTSTYSLGRIWRQRTRYNDAPQRHLSGLLFRHV